MNKRQGSRPHLLLWRTIWFSAGIFLVTFGYLVITETGSTAALGNKALAETAMLLIGCSFALSGLCYFFDVFDTKIIYRKHLGLVGFAFALAHGGLSLFYYLGHAPAGSDGSGAFELEHVWQYPGFTLSNLWAFTAALAAMLIFLMMAAISNAYALHELGGRRWRFLLRIGYLAYFLAVIHFSIKNIPAWIAALGRSPEPSLPPLNFIIFCFAFFVFGLRLALWWVLRIQEAAPASPSAGE